MVALDNTALPGRALSGRFRVPRLKLTLGPLVGGIAFSDNGLLINVPYLVKFFTNDTAEMTGFFGVSSICPQRIESGSERFHNFPLTDFSDISPLLFKVLEKKVKVVMIQCPQHFLYIFQTFIVVFQNGLRSIVQPVNAASAQKGQQQ